MAKKKKQSAVGIFFSFFLKAIVIILGLVILAMGAYLLRYTLTAEAENEDEVTVDESVLVSGSDDPLASGSDADDYDALLFDGEAETVESAESVDLSYEDKIVILNATDTKGLAGAWKDKFVAAGFQNVEVGNLFGNSWENSKIIVTEEGSGSNLNTVIENAPVEFGSPDSIECDAAMDGAKAIVIIGTDNDIVSQ